MDKIEASFNEMREIMANFVGLLDSYDERIMASEETIFSINKAVSSILNNLELAELIDLTDEI